MGVDKPADANNMEIQKLSYELSMYEQHAKQVEAQLKELQKLANNLNLTLDGLREFKKGKNSLYSLGSGVMVKGEITDDTNVLVDIGSGVLIELSREDAIDFMTKQIEAVMKDYNVKNQMLVNVVAHIDKLNKKAKRLLGEE